MSDELVWAFGFGSNMDVESLQNKKGIAITNFTPGYVQDWYLAFPVGGFDFVEPAFACAYAISDDSPADVQSRSTELRRLHGVAFEATRAMMDKLDAQEASYGKAMVDVHAYDGRTLQAWIYTGRPGRAPGTPSKRYLNVLLKGCREQGLDEQYIEELSRYPTYEPSTETLAARQRLLSLEPVSLPAVTVDELRALHEDGGDFKYTAIFGYVLKLKNLAMRSHGGRDITARMLRHIRQLPLDVDDDLGRPPFPRRADRTDVEEEYLRQWSDNYFVSKGGGDVACVVGFLSEWAEQLRE